MDLIQQVGAWGDLFFPCLIVHEFLFLFIMQESLQCEMEKRDWHDIWSKKCNKGNVHFQMSNPCMKHPMHKKRLPFPS